MASNYPHNNRPLKRPIFWNVAQMEGWLKVYKPLYKNMPKADKLEYQRVRNAKNNRKRWEKATNNPEKRSHFLAVHQFTNTKNRPQKGTEAYDRMVSVNNQSHRVKRLRKRTQHKRMDDFRFKVELQEYPDAPTPAPLCDVCRATCLRSAEYHCGKCSVHYCSDCVNKHNNNPLFRDHHAASLAQNVKSEPCVMHPGHQVGYLCRSCQPAPALCAVCMMAHPTNHDLVNIQDTAQQVRQNLQDDLLKVVKKTDELQEHVRIIQRKSELHDGVLRVIQDDIKNHAKLLVIDVENQAGEMLAAAKTKIEQLKTEYNQGAFSLDLSNTETVKREIESALRGPDQACITTYERLKEKIKYTTGAAAPNTAKILKDVEVKFVAGTMIKNFGTLKCSGGQKAAKSTDGVKTATCGKKEDKPKTPKRKTISDMDGWGTADSPAVKVGRTKEEARRGEEKPWTPVTLVARKPYKDMHPHKTQGRMITKMQARKGVKMPKILQQLPTMAARKPYKDLHPNKTQLCTGAVNEADPSVPSAREEPQRVHVCDLTAQHVFWDVRLMEEGGCTYVTEVCAVSTTGVMSTHVNHFTPIKHALQDLIKFLGTQPVVLVGHDIHAKCESLLAAVKDSNLQKKFDKVTAGFLDTLQLLKTKFKEVESPTVEKLHMHCFGKTYGADLEAGVQALQRLVLQVCPDRQERLSFSFKTTFIQDLKLYQEQRRQNLTTWKPLMDDKVISRHIADKAAASGLQLWHVRKVYDERGLDGLKAVLAKVSNGKARVTNRMEIIEEMGAYLTWMVKGKKTQQP